MENINHSHFKNNEDFFCYAIVKVIQIQIISHSLEL